MPKQRLARIDGIPKAIAGEVALDAVRHVLSAKQDAPLWASTVGAWPLSPVCHGG